MQFNSFLETLINFKFFCIFWKLQLYHACDSDSLQAFCLVKLNILQYVDFYSALLAFWVTLISLSNLPLKARSFFHLIGSVFLAIGVQYDRTSLWTFVIPVSAGFIIVILTWVKIKKLSFSITCKYIRKFNFFPLIIK